MSLICTNCFNSIDAIDSEGNKVCPVCSGKDFEEVTINNNTARCVYCGKLAKDTNYDDLPFYNSKNNTFYCGCRGWD